MIKDTEAFMRLIRSMSAHARKIKVSVQTNFIGPKAIRPISGAWSSRAAQAVESGMRSSLS